ncbi:MAG: endonuclease III [Candidatus Wildermuthbacteria bacterium]|nr:endonuclease III [Candidatus Wildermuthbacteria bacterium]
MPENLADRKKRVRKIIAFLIKIFPNARIALDYSSNWELLVAVILSAQCTDKKVNEITAQLFRKYKAIENYIAANPREFEQDIRSAGFYRNKTKNILSAANIIKEKYGGKVPNTMKEILEIPGVARKTANVVLGNAYGVVEGIAVDTHVMRLARKFGLTDNKNPDKIEQDLMAVVPKEDWFKFTYLLIEYGRQICPARKHDCANHPLSKL